jgi:hypothetical protein
MPADETGLCHDPAVGNGKFGRSPDDQCVQKIDYCQKNTQTRQAPQGRAQERAVGSEAAAKEVLNTGEGGADQEGQNGRLVDGPVDASRIEDLLIGHQIILDVTHAALSLKILLPTLPQSPRFAPGCLTSPPTAGVFQ